VPKARKVKSKALSCYRGQTSSIKMNTNFFSFPQLLSPSRRSSWLIDHSNTIGLELNELEYVVYIWKFKTTFRKKGVFLNIFSLHYLVEKLCFHFSFSMVVTKVFWHRWCLACPSDGGNIRCFIALLSRKKTYNRPKGEALYFDRSGGVISNRA